MLKYLKSSMPRGSRLLVALLALLSVLACAGFARAECFASDEVAPADAQCFLSKRANGVRGMWFSLKLSDEYLQLKQIVPELQVQVEKTQAASALKTRQIELLRGVASGLQATLETEREEGAALVKAKRKALEEAEAAKTELDRWYRSPWLWMGVGAVLTGGAVGGIYWVAH